MMGRICILIVQLCVISCLLYSQVFCGSEEKTITISEFEKRNNMTLADENVDCDAACFTIGSCNFEDYARLSAAGRARLFEWNVKVNELSCSDKECGHGRDVEGTYLSHKVGYVRETKGRTYPSLRIDNCCIYGHTRETWDSLPDCKFSEPGVRRLCSCRKKGEFEKRNKMTLADRNVDCETACSPVGSCNFEDYARLSDDNRVNLLEWTVQDNDLSCSDKRCQDQHVKGNYLSCKLGYEYETDNKTYPSLRLDNCCIYGHRRKANDPFPGCKLSERGVRRLCSCRLKGNIDRATTKFRATEITSSIEPSIAAQSTNNEPVAVTTISSSANMLTTTEYATAVTHNAWIYIAVAAVCLCLLLIILISVCICVLWKRSAENRKCNFNKSKQKSSLTHSYCGHPPKGGTKKSSRPVTPKTLKSKVGKAEAEALRIHKKEQGIKKMVGKSKKSTVVYSGKTTSYYDTYYEEVNKKTSACSDSAYEEVN